MRKVGHLNEQRHEEIRARRRDPEALFAWIAENRIPACINHPFSPLTGMMPPATNEFARLAGRAEGLAPAGGSDAHTLDGVGSAFTTVPRARDREEFLAGLRAGFCVPVGASGSYARLTRDVFTVFAGAAMENAAQALRSREDLARFLTLAPAISVLPIAPFVTLASYLHEIWGGRLNHWGYQASKAGMRAAGQPLLGHRLALRSGQ